MKCIKRVVLFSVLMLLLGNVKAEYYVTVNEVTWMYKDNIADIDGIEYEMTSAYIDKE